MARAADSKAVVKTASHGKAKSHSCPLPGKRHQQEASPKRRAKVLAEAAALSQQALKASFLVMVLAEKELCGSRLLKQGRCVRTFWVMPPLITRKFVPCMG